MESRRRSQWNSCIQLLLLFCCAAPGINAASKGEFDRMFVFGDSFVDIGNRDPGNSTYTAIGRVNQNWQVPFGRTHPGKPSGRFSNGKVLSDFLGNYMGLHPVPYRNILNASSLVTPSVKDGINFAVAGSGVFDNLGFTKTSDQIRQLEAILHSGHLYPKDDPDVFCKSLVTYAISGNDYAAYRRNNDSTDVLSVIAFVASVVGQMRVDFDALFALGFRHFVVGKLAPVGCLPFASITYNFTACEESFNGVATLHNVNLAWMVAATMSHANVLFLDNQLAFGKVAYDKSKPGRLKPCCNGVQFGSLCGDRNDAGKPLFTVCGPYSTDEYFWWDEFHPTEAGWGYIFSLFLQGFPFLYTDGKSLPEFLGIHPHEER